MEVLSRNWGWLLALSLLMIVLGVFAIGAPVVATIAVQLMLGWLLVIGGIAQGIHAFMVPNKDAQLGSTARSRYDVPETEDF
jgi:uncharacterized membrane protein HdeD (DUF308 family)